MAYSANTRLQTVEDVVARYDHAGAPRTTRTARQASEVGLYSVEHMERGLSKDLRSKGSPSSSASNSHQDGCAAMAHSMGQFIDSS
jgi:hypothetical protein